MKVFVVDDASFIRILCRHYVTKAGYEMVGDAYDGPVALEQICKTQPDCVIMDLALPGLNGTDIIRHVHEKFSHIQFIIVSALDEDFCKNQIEDLSYVKFITKPFDAEQISEALQLAEQNLEKAKHG